MTYLDEFWPESYRRYRVERLSRGTRVISLKRVVTVYWVGWKGNTFLTLLKVIAVVLFVTLYPRRDGRFSGSLNRVTCAQVDGLTITAPA